MGKTIWFAKKLDQCPRCKSNYIRLDRRQGILEKLVYRVLLLWPYNCRNCELRFLNFSRSYNPQD
jgi:predicted Zn-ribbon and HTH transcriptional regulator